MTGGPRHLLAFCALGVLTPMEANAGGEVGLFSAVRGVALDHGKPATGAVIERSHNWA